MSSDHDDGPTTMMPGPGKERKVVHNASSKVSLVVQRMLLPLLQAPLRTHVVFDVEEDQLELDLIEQMGARKPDILEDPQTFVEHLRGLFDRYKQWQSPSGAYSRVCVFSRPC
jgi:hypothetical protein